jgi:dTMP kinase
LSTISGAGPRPANSLFITFEGPDGSGKSTQSHLLAERLRREGHTVLETVEPGGTPIGQQIRRILLDPANQELRAIPELLLMFAARAQNVEQAILPALRQGHIVVSDRFTDSSIAYQGAARGLGWETVLDVDRIACQGLVPDLTLCIDIDTETGLARAHSRNLSNVSQESRIDEQAVEFHHKVRDAYHELAQREPRRVRLIDGIGSQEEVAAKVWDLAAALLKVV